MSNTSLTYIKALIITSDETISRISRYILTKTRCPIKIEACSNVFDMNLLDDIITKSKDKFIKKYLVRSDFKIFVHADISNITQDNLTRFTNKNLFKNTWAYDYIIPIYNLNSLSDIFDETNIPYTIKTSKTLRKSYLKVFPLNTQDINILNVEEIKLFNSLLRKSKNTNISQFIEYCIE